MLGSKLCSITWPCPPGTSQPFFNCGQAWGQGLHYAQQNSIIGYADIINFSCNLLCAYSMLGNHQFGHDNYLDSTNIQFDSTFLVIDNLFSMAEIRRKQKNCL